MSATGLALPRDSARPAPAGARVEVLQRLLVRLLSFAALGVYGVLRWSTLLADGSRGRLFALLGLALLAAGAVSVLSRYSRLACVLVALVPGVLALTLAGLPWSWIVHVRIAVAARAIGDGLAALPGLIVPYSGINQWARTVLVLGGGLLALGGGLLLGFVSLTTARADRRGAALRRAVAAVPLLALAVVPATLLRPQLPYLDGLLLFVLVLVFVWAEDVGRAGAGPALALCAGAGLIALIVAPALELGHPLINYRAAANRLAKAGTVEFNWTQRYGPIRWPRTGRTVLMVRAANPEYWKAENLDVFDGAGWTQGAVVSGADPMTSVSSATVARWTERAQVTVGAMHSSEVIGAGLSSSPSELDQTVFAAASPGTWATAPPLQAGDSYLISVYAPDPSAAQLRAAGTDYPAGLLPGYLTLLVPLTAHQSNVVALGPGRYTPPPLQQVLIAPYGSTPGRAYGPTSLPAGPTLALSPYARAYRLARALERGSRTPYGFALAIKRYLAHGFAYDEATPATRYPLASFLFDTHEGYCQQFAGAMALLLRLGGVPARVSVGFTAGRYDTALHEWVVTDVDAHAWVEAWFPHYGWVRFDPTPASDPALGGKLSRTTAGATLGVAPKSPTGSGTHGLGGSAPGAQRSHRADGTLGVAVSIVFGLLAVALALAGCVLASRRGAAPHDSVLELERALRRTGRPLAPDVTLAALERRFAASPEAAAYVRGLRIARFGGEAAAPTTAQRRALRAQLAAGLGLLGRLRAIWALPPRIRSSAPLWRRLLGA